MGFLVKDLSISRCDVAELKLAILMLTEELNFQALMMGNDFLRPRSIPKEQYDALSCELTEYEGLLYLKTRERLIWRWLGDYEWKQPK